MKLTFIAFSGLVNALTSFSLVAFILLKKSRTSLDRRFAWFAFSVGYWALNYFLWLRASDYNHAIFWIRNTMAGAIFIPSTFMHLVFVLVDSTDKHKPLIWFNYILSSIFLFFCFFTPFYIESVQPKLYFSFWPTPGLTFHLMLLHFMANVVYAHILMWKAIQQTTGNKRNQIKYVFVGTFIGFTGGCTNYFLWYNIPIAPYFNFLVTIYIVSLAYAVVRYRLLDVTVAFTRTTIFLFLYAFLLGMPAVFIHRLRPWFDDQFGDRWMIFVLLIYGGLASAVPFLYSLLQTKAEARLLKNQRHYQHTLLQASRGMTLIKELPKLLGLIVHMLTKTVGIAHASVYLFDEENNIYERKAVRRKSLIGDKGPCFHKDSPLVTHLTKTQSPLVTEELRFQGPHEPDSLLFSVQKELEGLKAALIISSFIRETLIGFLVLGEKKSGQIYTQDDLNILATLANQAALAFENCEFIKKVERTQAQLFQAAKMADLGTMASGIGHQINNRLNAIKLAAEVAIMVELKHIREDLEKKDGEAVKKRCDNLEQSLRRAADNATRGADIVKRLLDFSRLSEGFDEVDFNEVLENCLKLWAWKKDLTQIDFRNDVKPGLPKLWGNFPELEEVIINLIDNGYDAIKMKEEAWERGTLPRPEGPAGKGILRITATPTEKAEKKYLEVKVEDTGIGMTEEAKTQLFVPFFTTKATSIKGTGLGLFVIKQMVDAHKGEIVIESEYGKGTTFMLLLPLADGRKKKSEPKNPPS